MSAGASYKYKHLAANTTGVIVSPNALVVLGKVTINTKGASANLLSIYDTNTTASTSSSNLVAAVDTTANVGYIDFDSVMNTGIVAVLATGTAADLTITFT